MRADYSLEHKLKAIKLPTWPRLQSGIGFRWQLQVHSKDVRIVPISIPIALIMYFLLLGVVQFVIVNIVLAVSGNYFRYCGIIGWSAAMLLFFVLIGAFIYSYYRYQHQLGPVLVVDVDHGIVRLPRHNREYPAEWVKSVDIVSGRHVAHQIQNAKPSWQVNPYVQLQLRVQDNCEEFAFPLLMDGGSHNRRFEEAAGVLAKTLNVAVLLIDEDKVAPGR